MNILYICALNYKNKTGLYNATINRIQRIEKMEKVKVKVFSLMKEDSSTKRKIKKIKKLKIEDKIVSTYTDGVEVTNLIYVTGIKDIFLRKFEINLDIEYYFQELSKYIENNNIDIIHAHWTYPQGYIAKLLSEKYNIPYMITAHGSDIHTTPFLSNNLMRKTLECLDEAKGIFFVSEKLKNQAQNLGMKNENIFISFNGINSDIKSTDIEVCSEKKIIGYVGNLVKVKGIQSLPKIFDTINREVDCKFIVIGSGQEKIKIELEMKEKKLDCEFLGYLNAKEVKGWMKKFDILVVPSENEGWPLVILEANLEGTYVVGSDVGGVSEAINDFGSVISRGEAFEKRFGKEVLKVLKSGYDKEQLITYAKKFDWSTIVENELSIYKEILNLK